MRLHPDFTPTPAQTLAVVQFRQRLRYVIAHFSTTRSKTSRARQLLSYLHPGAAMMDDRQLLGNFLFLMGPGIEAELRMLEREAGVLQPTAGEV